MTVALSGALQSAVYAAVSAALTDVPVFDAQPSGQLPGLYVLLGEEDVKDASDATGTGSWHRFELSVHGEAEGFPALKEVSAQIWQALDGADLAMSEGRLVGLWFQQAKARRQRGGGRRITLTFRARIEQD